MSRSSFDDDNDDAPGPLLRRTEFECPDCNAHNPVDDGFTFGDEITCFYCGMSYEVRDSDGKMKLRAV
jgi:transcription elongation factor Elf1